MTEALAFYLLAGLLVGSSLAIVLTPNIVRAAIWLLGALGSAAGLYLLLGANFVAAIQLIVYAGGILVLIVFGIMLTTRSPRARFEARPAEMIIAAALTSVLFVALLVVTLGGPWPAATDIESPAAPATVSEIGRALLTTWLVPFELISVLLLAVMIGAAYLARPRRA